jgi:hypothetical protein
MALSRVFVLQYRHEAKEKTQGPRRMVDCRRFYSSACGLHIRSMAGTKSRRFLLSDRYPPQNVNYSSNAQAPPGEGAAPKQADESTTHSESYFCRLIAPANLPADYLVIMGVGGVLAALATLDIISRQARSMRYQTTHLKNAAESARDSAKALIASERAWIDGEVAKRDIVGVMRYSLNVMNQGKTPAQIINYDIWHGLLEKNTEFSKDKLGTHFTASDGLLLASNGTRTLMKDFDMDDFFTLDSGDHPTPTTQDGIQYGAFCVTIRYEDVVTEGQQRRLHQTSFVYLYSLLFSTIERIAQYNEYT